MTAQEKINEEERSFDIFKLCLAAIIISVGLWYWVNSNYKTIEEIFGGAEVDTNKKAEL